jgi:hypothetical protein
MCREVLTWRSEAEPTSCWVGASFADGPYLELIAAQDPRAGAAQQLARTFRVADVNGRTLWYCSGTALRAAFQLAEPVKKFDKTLDAETARFRGTPVVLAAGRAGWTFPACGNRQYFLPMASSGK